MDGHMGAPLHYYACAGQGWILGKIELIPSLSDVVMSWLRLKIHLDYIPHPCNMYTQCFSTLICRGWAFGCTLTLLHLCRSGVGFRKIGVGGSLSDVVMSWLMLQTHLECIPHPNHMYTKCFSTLIRCGWAYGCTVTLLHLCMVLIYYALPVVCTSSHILLAKRSILTKAQVEPMMDILFPV